MMKEQEKLMHKEAVKNALEMLGGKAQLKQIYPVAIYHISKWEGMGAPQRAVTLLNKLREALKL